MTGLLRVGLAQIAPVWLDRAATLIKLQQWVERAAGENCQFVAFGEALLPGYPFWIEHTDGARFESALQKRLFAHYVDQAVQIERGWLLRAAGCAALKLEPAAPERARSADRSVKKPGAKPHLNCDTRRSIRRAGLKCCGATVTLYRLSQSHRERMTQLRKFRQQTVPPWRRAVLKVGSSLLAADGGGLSTRYALGLAQFISACHASGREIVLVSSGAVAAGRMMLRDHSPEDASNAARQAMAALGQTQTVALWQRLFDLPLAQVLLTHDDLRDRRRYLNARATLSELLTHKVMPVVNENDTVAIDELTLGDNDNLAAIIAALVDADMLLIATDIDGLYTADPRSDPSAMPIDEVAELTPEIMTMAGAAGSSVGTGGMRTKLEAAEKAAAAGIETILFNGRDSEVVNLLARDLLHGTLLRTSSSRLQARKYWLRHVPAVPGHIHVDAGAIKAICKDGASLLPKGIIGARGSFQRGDMVEIVGDDGQGTMHMFARGITQYSAAEINRVAGTHTREIEGRLGYSYGESVVHRDDLAMRRETDPVTGDFA